MKSARVRFLCALLAAMSFLTVFSGCSGGPDEAEAKEIVAELVEASLPLNVIYYGDGMKVEEPEEGMAALYANVADGEPYLTEAELREATLLVFTENFANTIIFRTFLEGYSSDDASGVVFARYIENGDRLQRRLDSEQLIESGKERTYDLDDIEITRSRKDEIRATLHSYVAGKRDADVEVTVRLEEREAEGTASETGMSSEGNLVWRLDSPTY